MKVGEILVSKRDYSWMKESEMRWDSFYPKFYLTKGKNYTITKITEDYIYVKNGCGVEEEFCIKEEVEVYGNINRLRDPGQLTNYWGDWFYTKQESRDIRIGEILV